MALKITLNTKHSISALTQAIKQSSDEKQKTRLRAIINIKNGDTYTKTASIFAVTRTTLRYWVAEYNQGGIKALSMNKGGRLNGNPKWDTNIFDKLVTEINKGEQCWSIPLMQEWVENQYKKEIPESTIWYHLNRLNISYKSSRPHPYKGDREAQSEFKKGA